MCTLTYIPTSEGYIFTHNRDERQDRPTSPDWQQREINGQQVFYPEDLEANGSWIAFADSKRAICLMNGGSKNYDRSPPYRHSRGLVVLDYFRYPSLPGQYQHYDFSNLEPFTLVVREDDHLWKLIHDEDETRLEALDPGQKQIWSSTTLYSPEVRQKRQEWFERWLTGKPALTPENVRQFHLTGGEGDAENDLVMSRWGLLKTLSITQISLQGSQAQLHYRDFVQGSEDTRSVSLHPPAKP